MIGYQDNYLFDAGEKMIINSTQDYKQQWISAVKNAVEKEKKRNKINPQPQITEFFKKR